MKKRKLRLVDWWWLLLLPIAVFALAFETGGASAAASAGVFPAFIPMSGVTPTGVAVDKVGNVYVSIREMRADGQYGLIWKYTPAGEQSFFAQIGKAEIYGLAVTANGDLYAAMGRVGSDKGVYRVDRKGNIELLPGTDQIVWANALAFDDQGTLYITETHSGSPSSYGPGGIWRIPRGGQAELWLQHGLLTGIGAVMPYPIGANGIVYDHGDLYVTNTDKGLVVRIPVQKDGSAGVPVVWAMLQEVPESPLAWSALPLMGDDLRLDVHGNIYVAVLTRSAVVRINALDLSQETIAAFPVSPLDFPPSLAFGTGKGERTNLFVTNLGMGKVFVPQLPWPGFGLVKIDAGVPGRPLH